MLGGPVPDATQGDQIARGADGGYGVVTHLETARWGEEDWGMLPRVLRAYERL